MVQEFHVVRCFSCECFQSQQVCKKPKFTCKMCGAKQSVRKEYGRGSGKDCRIHVQKLNGLVGSLEAEQEQRIDAQLLECEEFEDVNHFGYQTGCDDYQESYGYRQRHQFYQEGYQEYSDSLCGAVDPGTLTEGYSKTGNMVADELSANKNSKWSTYLTNEEDTDDISEDKTSSFSTARQFYSQNGACRKTKSDTSVEEVELFQSMMTEGDGISGPYFKPPVKTTQSPAGKATVSRKQNQLGLAEIPEMNFGKATVSRKQNQLGLAEIPEMNFEENFVKRKSKWNSYPYPASGSSKLSRLCKSQREFSQTEDVDLTLQAGNTGASHDVASKQVQSTLSNVGLKALMPLKEKSGNSFGRSHCDRPSSNHVMHLEEKSGNSFNRSRCDRPSSSCVMPLNEKSGDNFNRSHCYKPASSLALKRKLQDEDPDSELGTGKISKPQQLDHRSIGVKKQQSLISCLENDSTFASFKKYELADDIDDINFDL